MPLPVYFPNKKMIEQWGSRVPRIIREVSAYGLSDPEFFDMECVLRLNIYRNANVVLQIKRYFKLQIKTYFFNVGLT